MRYKDVIRSNWFLLKKVHRFDPALFYLRMAMAVLASASAILTILMPMFLLESIIEHDFRRIFVVVVFFTVSFLALKYISMWFAVVEKIRSEKMYVQIINEFLSNVVDLDYEFFENTKSFEVYDRAFGNSCKVIDNVNAVFTSLISAAINIVLWVFT